jgi:hypothetical protein
VQEAVRIRDGRVVSRGVAGLCVLLALAVGAVGAALLDGDDATTRTETRAVVPRAVAAPARTARSARVPRYALAGRLVLQHLVPSDAEVQWSWRLPAAGGVPEQIVVTWARSRVAGEPTEYGLTLWQMGPYASWRRLYRFNAPPARHNDGLEVFGIGVAVQDVSGDGHLDVLSWQDLGGTSGGGAYRLVITADGSARQVFRRETDTDHETMGLQPGALIVDRGTKGSEDRLGSIHPAYKRWQRTSYRWDGTRLVPIGQETVGLRRHIDPPAA